MLLILFLQVLLLLLVVVVVVVAAVVVHYDLFQLLCTLVFVIALLGRRLCQEKPRAREGVLEAQGRHGKEAGGGQAMVLH